MERSIQPPRLSSASFSQAINALCAYGAVRYCYSARDDHLHDHMQRERSLGLVTVLAWSLELDDESNLTQFERTAKEPQSSGRSWQPLKTGCWCFYTTTHFKEQFTTPQYIFSTDKRFDKRRPARDPRLELGLDTFSSKSSVLLCALLSRLLLLTWCHFAIHPSERNTSKQQTHRNGGDTKKPLARAGRRALHSAALRHQQQRARLRRGAERHDGHAGAFLLLLNESRAHMCLCVLTLLSFCVCVCARACMMQWRNAVGPSER